MSGRAREDVSDRLSGCTGISNTRRHMIQGSEVILTDEYRAESRLPHKRKGVVFYSPSLESLFQGSILPTRDCKPVSRQKSYVHKYYACFFYYYWPAKTSSDTFSRSDSSVGVIGVVERRLIVPMKRTVACVPAISTGFGRLQFAARELCERTLLFCVYPLVLSASSHKVSH